MTMSYVNPCGCEAPRVVDPLSPHFEVICCACHAVLERRPIDDCDAEPVEFASFVETCLACDLPAPNFPLCPWHRFDAIGDAI